MKLSVVYARKLAEYRAKQERAKARAQKRQRVKNRLGCKRWRRAHKPRRLTRKQRAKAHLKEVLRLARVAMGWKPSGPKGGKLSPEHKAALHEGRRMQARRKKKALV
jgi:hypothetical protein